MYGIDFDISCGIDTDMQKYGRYTTLRNNNISVQFQQTYLHLPLKPNLTLLSFQLPTLQEHENELFYPATVQFHKLASQIDSHIVLNILNVNDI